MIKKLLQAFTPHNSVTSSLIYVHYRPTKVILYDDMGRGTNDDSFTWNEYGRPSFSTAAAVGHEVSAGDVDAVYHGIYTAPFL